MMPKFNPIKSDPKEMVGKIEQMLKEVNENFSTVNALNIKKAMIKTIIENL